VDGTLVKPRLVSRSLSKSVASNGSVFHGSDIESDDGSDAASEEHEDGSFELPQQRSKAKPPPHFSEDDGGQLTNSAPSKPSIANGTKRDLHYCGLCATTHADGIGECFMTDRSEHLAEFREMLLLHADDEPPAQRVTFFTFLIFNSTFLFILRRRLLLLSMQLLKDAATNISFKASLFVLY
jgi:chromodomain-helicase-DNA-binding protein 4